MSETINTLNLLEVQAKVSEADEQIIRADERAKVLGEVMTIVKAKISEKEYLMDTMVELTDLGARIQKLKEQSND